MNRRGAPSSRITIRPLPWAMLADTPWARRRRSGRAHAGAGQREPHAAVAERARVGRDDLAGEHAAAAEVDDDAHAARVVGDPDAGRRQRPRLPRRARRRQREPGEHGRDRERRAHRAADTTRASVASAGASWDARRRRARARAAPSDRRAARAGQRPRARRAGGSRGRARRRARAAAVDRQPLRLARAREDRARGDRRTRIGGAVGADEKRSRPDDSRAGGPAAPTPTFDHSGGSTVTINADSAVDFSQKIVSTIGAPHVKPRVRRRTIEFDDVERTRRQGSPTPQDHVDRPDREDRRSSRSASGMGRVDDENLAMIRQMVAEIQAHEERHRKIIEDAATAALKDGAEVRRHRAVRRRERRRSPRRSSARRTRSTRRSTARRGCSPSAEVRQPDGKIKLSLSKSGSGAKYPCPK